MNFYELNDIQIDKKSKNKWEIHVNLQDNLRSFDSFWLFDLFKLCSDKSAYTKIGDKILESYKIFKKYQLLTVVWKFTMSH